MKKYIVLLLIVMASCKSKSPNSGSDTKEAYSRYVKMDFKEVNSAKKNRAYDLGKRLLETCNTSKFKSFSKDEATESVIKNATVEKISKTCQKIIMRNGKFIDLQLSEVIHDVETDDYLFKYKIQYEKKYFERELNVTINKDGKVAAMNTKELAKKPM
ncbi:hypothetical protein [Flavobacterium aquatile]|uniref:Lipoprotein n=1 Tax=Flavobacterium aquatile LMG 4008 = ATCC 11947 TaxID=1453498 RepID=A0A095UYA4_9FLAO|nr:hypothetical protein [Flavobacterium aquatile]KGD67555.1 hypothetical protein LG45_10465 [Flavobacterium aquatile LMG 4008 = ATCC 11947]OXA65512.1 hypothetical protein B0A61_15045 [Flavobacterium aquatile LMG 4008 = ATCC 11947]GEC80107.1 hypothetical protein FAQ01_29770 [Flavobacterium aquatile]